MTAFIALELEKGSQVMKWSKALHDPLTIFVTVSTVTQTGVALAARSFIETGFADRLMVKAKNPVVLRQ